MYWYRPNGVLWLSLEMLHRVTYTAGFNSGCEDSFCVAGGIDRVKIFNMSDVPIRGHACQLMGLTS